MDYNIIAKEILTWYPISEPVIQFIRHNENMTFKITDGVNKKNYLLRIHNPSTEGLLGLQHTLEGIESEIKILQELNQKGLLYAQKPISNTLGVYITEYKMDNFNHPCYATILEWIEGCTLTLEEDNIKDLAFTLGQNLALFHTSLKEFKPSKDFIRPIYDADRIDTAIDELKYCVEANLFSMEHYDIIKRVLIIVKNQMNELKSREDSFGIIHADFQPGNIVVNNGNPVLIDLGFCGFGYYFFDLGSAATIFPSELRQTFLQGYASKTSFSFDDLRYIEGQIFMDTFISYLLFMRDSERNSWIKDSSLKICDSLCKDFLEGNEVFYLL
ncbi:phosphotransferase enzyme family protein [Anaeromicropila herbilytica]|uniref:Aminoglycoside phosphotransferase n=1 Tax=Anaeromicropila herbilytica TaxID=2785025 RepID=A0A7R7EN73_9FIRM|nr:phosphotransferase [Anaeromicropila herbilytica]BCN31888.1 aminoglycoside phosphotransferase [Anaeromicropila herbilytica]